MTGILAECPAHFKMGSDLKLTEMNYSFCDSSESLLVRQPKNKFKISTTRLRTIALIRCINGSHFFSLANLECLQQVLNNLGNFLRKIYTFIVICLMFPKTGRQLS